MTLDDTIGVLIESLRENGATPDLISKTVNDLRTAAKEEQAAKEAATKTKTRLAVLVRGDAALQSALAGGAWIVSVPDDDTTNTYMSTGLVDRLRAAVVEHNESPKRKRASRIETWFQAFTTLKPKTIKASGSQVGIKQKGSPAEVVVLTSEQVAP